MLYGVSYGDARIYKFNDILSSAHSNFSESMHRATGPAATLRCATCYRLPCAKGVQSPAHEVCRQIYIKITLLRDVVWSILQWCSGEYDEFTQFLPPVCPLLAACSLSL